MFCVAFHHDYEVTLLCDCGHNVYKKTIRRECNEILYVNKKSCMDKPIKCIECGSVVRVYWYCDPGEKDVVTVYRNTGHGVIYGKTRNIDP